MAKEITIYDIAEKLNLSAATVSRGLKNYRTISESTRKRIMDTAREMGYRSNTFASNLRLQRTNTIGVIVPRLNSNFMSDVIAGIEKAANKAGYNLIISQSLETTKKEAENVATMFNSRVDGLLVSLAYDTANTRHFEQFINKGIPVIFFDRVIQHAICPGITINNFNAGYEATSHLIFQNCKRILHISGDQTGNVYKDRLNGYKKALEDHGLVFDEALVVINKLSFEDGTKTASDILRMQQKPDGVFAANDSCAIACMLELKKAGVRIPEEIAFVGFNNDPVALVIEPQLSTINYPGEEMGEHAANVLFSHLNNTKDTPPEHDLLLKHELIVRGSSARAITT
ncbi:LacI family DNA-binding transcriptional regulator [Desertivirga brevis]|uniref:LacI family DNA-binding transcriptional regulator n=1 Tax=Desertivirga brevis TaxID=2810310 RepID=UPI001A9727F1|nr:LacI family DNA-binding transcriptional regulator [Pedobacter sp. SYSU D00873]